LDFWESTVGNWIDCEWFCDKLIL